MSDEGPWKHYPGDEYAESQFLKLRQENGEESKEPEHLEEETAALTIATTNAR